MVTVEYRGIRAQEERVAARAARDTGDSTMPLYEYYCPRCAAKYELLRPMERSDEPGTCPRGHGGGARTLSLFATVARGDGSSIEQPVGGGGCACGGGGCGCGH
jgi:putative FmdB family regulatory protein